MTAGVGEDRGPPVAVDVVDRPFFGDLERVATDRPPDQVVVVAVRDEVDTAVEDVNAVVTGLRSAGQHDGVPMCRTGVHSRAGCGDLERSVVHFVGSEVDDGEVRF